MVTAYLYENLASAASDVLLNSREDLSLHVARHLYRLHVLPARRGGVHAHRNHRINVLRRRAENWRHRTPLVAEIAGSALRAPLS